MNATKPSSRRPRSPGLLYSAMTMAILVVLGVIALTARQPPPPTIAEFAPQAIDRIEDAPEEQTSAVGSAPGRPEARATPPPAEAESAINPIDVPRVRRCVGDPPRQTDDPQSPPCVPYWQGDNGGVTSPGVTREEVRVAIPANADYLPQILAHFNSRYEFYGRKIVPVRGLGGGNRPEEMVAVAEKAKSENVFASSMYGDSGGREYVYYDRLARHGIVSVDGRPGMSDESRYQRNHPYQWSYLPGHDKMSRNQAEWICRSLNGKAPQFAGGAERARSQRVFGLVTTVHSDGTGPDLGPMKATLSACGIDLRGREATMQMRQGDDAAGVAEGQNVIVQMQTAGVTTIICQCHTQSSGLYMYPMATKQGYNPEWLVSTYMYQAEDSHAAFWDGAQVEQTFGLSWWSKQLPPQDSPWYWAIKESDPNARFPDSFSYYAARWLYNPLLIVASGIQLAGPNLTPETFARGLQTARWPNPNAGAAPYWQGEIGFGPTDHTAVNDAAIVWLTKRERSTWDTPGGATCHAQLGTRYRLGKWPTDYAGLYQRPCN